MVQFDDSIRQSDVYLPENVADLFLRYGVMTVSVKSTSSELDYQHGQNGDEASRTECYKN